MSARTKKKFALLIVFSAVAGSVGGFFLMVERTKGAQEDPQLEESRVLKPFQWGYDLGQERAGFSGLDTVYVFADSTVNLPVLEACLDDPAVEAAMGTFVGVILSETEEDAVARRLREKDLQQVVVESLSGRYRGSLPPGFTCDELVLLLESIARRRIIKPALSPIRSRLRVDPTAIDEFVARGEIDRARKYLDFLKEFEGADSPVALAVEARIPQ